MAVGSKIQPGRGRFKHGFIELKFGLDILFILENSWFDYIGDQRKSPKNETPLALITFLFLFLFSPCNAKLLHTSNMELYK